MPRKKGHYGSGTIDQQGEHSWRLRYRIAGRRFTKTVQASKTAAAKELRRLLHDADAGTHVAPDRITVEELTAGFRPARRVGERRRSAPGRWMVQPIDA
jgi:hypothetical protein